MQMCTTIQANKLCTFQSVSTGQILIVEPWPCIPLQTIDCIHGMEAGWGSCSQPASVWEVSSRPLTNANRRTMKFLVQVYLNSNFCLMFLLPFLRGKVRPTQMYFYYYIFGIGQIRVKSYLATSCASLSLSRDLCLVLRHLLIRGAAWEMAARCPCVS